MKLFSLIICLLMTLVVAQAAESASKDSRVYEMRVYYAPEGKLDELNARFRNHTLKLFEKHGIQNIGYWMPIENPDRKLIYFLAYPSREAREASWKAFMADPDWQKAYKESEKNGRLVTKVETLFLQSTDYSPEVKLGAGTGDRIFELRTYTTTPGKLEDLNARFRDHTLKLFEKHGMQNVVYWVPMKDQKGADNTLMYILAHKSVDAAKKSFDDFRKDPDWIAAKDASEKKAGGSLTVPDGVKSVYMKATDYSPIK